MFQLQNWQDFLIKIPNFSNFSVRIFIISASLLLTKNLYIYVYIYISFGKIQCLKEMKNVFSSKSLEQIKWRLHYTPDQNHFKLSSKEEVPKGNMFSWCLCVRKPAHSSFPFYLLHVFLDFRWLALDNPNTFAKQEI